jgi:VWFA-related protein
LRGILWHASGTPDKGCIIATVRGFSCLSRSPWSLYLVAVLGVTLLPAAAQQPPAPAFPSSQGNVNNVPRVTLDVRVVDEHGQFVPNLTAEDFLVLEDGVQQTLSTFDVVDIPVGPAGTAGPVNPVKPVGADSASNDVTREQRLYILLLDDLRTDLSRSATVAAQARDFIEHRLADSDRAVVLATSGTSGMKGVVQQFTNNRQWLLDAIDKVEAGFGARGKCNGDPQGCACSDDRTAYRSISGIARWLVPVLGQRKAVLLFGEGDVAGGRALAPMPDNMDPLGNPLGGPFGDDRSVPGIPVSRSNNSAVKATCEAIDEDRRDAADVAARANVTVYLVDPRQNADAEFTRIVADTSSYYLLGYAPASDKHNGTFRKIEVRARRPGFTATTRAGYTAQNDAPPKKVSPQPPLPVALAELISSPVAASGVTMSVTAPVFRGKAGKASVEVIVDVARRDLTTSGGLGKLELLDAVADSDGRIRASERGSLDMKLSARSGDTKASQGVRVLSRLDVAPGRYMLRVTGTDSNGKSQGPVGTVQYDLDVPDFAKDPITMSGLVLSLASEASQPTTGSDKDWQKRFDYAPTARRAFSAADELTVAGEAYINEKAPGAIEATTMVLRPSGEVAVQTKDLLDADGRSAAYRYESTVALSGLQPGDYIFKVEVRSGAAAASREIPFVVVAGLTTPGVTYITEPSLGAVLKRAAAYVAEFSKKVSGLVAEETYEQDAAANQHRVLKSDFLLVQLPGWAHPAEFRDVFEVDGQPVRDREERLTQLFLTPSKSRSQVEAIVAESARYNIGNIARTMNTPMLPLEFLAAGVQKGFEFRRTTDSKPLRVSKTENPGGPFAVPENAWVIEYRETEKETVIRNQQGRNIYSYGRFWIDPRSGRILMSELRADGGGVAVVVDVSYRSDDAAGVAVPVEMRESYDPIQTGSTGPPGVGVRGVATYGHFRQFRVQTDESVAPSVPEEK